MQGEEREQAIPKDDEKFWPLAKLQAELSGRSVSEEIRDQINLFLEQEVEEARTSPDPLVGVRALVGVRRCCQVLSANGYAGFGPALRLMQKGIESIRRRFLRELVRRLLRDEILEPQAAECLQLLQGLVDSGQWGPENYKQDCDAAQKAAFGA